MTAMEARGERPVNETAKRPDEDRAGSALIPHAAPSGDAHANGSLGQTARGGGAGTPGDRKTEAAAPTGRDAESGDATEKATADAVKAGRFVMPKVAQMWRIPPGQKLTLPDGMKLELPPNLPVVPGSAPLTDEQ
jgi:hypothetical protein